jgi:hypothetical protein
MPSPVFISLDKEEDSTLYELSVANGVPRRTKLRALVVLQKLFKDRAIFTISSRSRSNSKNLIHEFYLT